MSDARVLPKPLTDVRALPYGTYVVRVVHQQERDGAHGTREQQVTHAYDNTPHVVLLLEEHPRTYVLDDAQQFRIGSMRGEAPGMFDRYRLTVSKLEGADRTGIVEDVTRDAMVRYEKL